MMAAPTPILAAGARADDGRTALTIAGQQGHAPVARRLRGEMP